MSLGLTPDAAYPVEIPVRELTGTAVFFHSARVQFLASELITNTAPTDLDLSVTPIYQYTTPLEVTLPGGGVANLVARVLLPGSVARDVTASSCAAPVVETGKLIGTLSFLASLPQPRVVSRSTTGCPSGGFPYDVGYA